MAEEKKLVPFTFYLTETEARDLKKVIRAECISVSSHMRRLARRDMYGDDMRSLARISLRQTQTA